MQFIKFIENIFSNHPVLSVAFSGFGISLISALIYIIRKILTSHKHSNQQVLMSEPENATTISSQPELAASYPEIESDIKTIEKSINYDPRYMQERKFLRYFNKYKNNFCQNDVESGFVKINV